MRGREESACSRPPCSRTCVSGMQAGRHASRRACTHATTRASKQASKQASKYIGNQQHTTQLMTTSTYAPCLCIAHCRQCGSACVDAWSRRRTQACMPVCGQVKGIHDWSSWCVLYVLATLASMGGLHVRELRMCRDAHGGSIQPSHARPGARAAHSCADRQKVEPWSS